MSAMHVDFAKCAMERAEQIDWAHRLFCSATDEDSFSSHHSFSSWSSSNLSEERGVLRPLLETEIHTLEQQCRCRSSDWSKLRLMLPEQHVGEDHSVHLQRLVTDTFFEGTCVLILSKTEKIESNKNQSTTSTWNKLPLGIHSCSVIFNCVVYLHSARVHRCTLMENTVVGADAVVTNCGSITCNNNSNELLISSSHQLLELTVGPESGGGRPMRLTPEATMLDVSRQLRSVTADPPTPPSKHWNRNLTIIGKNCIVRDTSTIDAVYLHPTASIVASSSVQD